MDRRGFLFSLSTLPLVAPVPAAFGSPAIEYRLGSDAIHILRGPQRIRSITSARPAALIQHPKRPVLFVVNDVPEHAGLPTGTVEAYAIESGGAHLRLLRRQQLALAAVHPRHAALSPDAQHLVVASQSAGIYNVLSVSPQGELGPVMQALKVLGTDQAMHRLTFDPSGQLVRSFRADGTLIAQLTFLDGQLRR